MPVRVRGTMVQTSARLLALLSLLQMRREWTGQELADRLEVGPRTIRRDVDKLRSLGYPVEAAPGVAGGYRLGNGGELPPLLLDDAEAVAVAVGLRTAAAGSIAGIEETSVRALAKLEQVLPNRLRRRVSALSDATSAFGVEGPRIDADVLATLAGACRDRTPPALRLRRQGRARLAAQHRAARRRLQRPPLVPASRSTSTATTGARSGSTGSAAALRPGERGRRRTVPGGDPAAYVKARLRGTRDNEPERGPGRVRLAVPAGRTRDRIPARYATSSPTASRRAS